MCGIVGFSGRGDSATASKMLATIRHRGPDDSGVFFHGKTGLGHARLSIIDLSPTGHQPMTSADGTVHIVFNGEIYNYRELRAELLKKQSYPFRGASDTEVLLALYQMHGVDMFAKLNGMFALALYDQGKDLLILSRDRLGKKPLYYGVFGDTLIFGSEPKALLAHPACIKQLNPQALAHYLHSEYVPTPLSIFEGIAKLEPATYALWHDHTLTKKVFWRTHFDEVSMDEHEALARLDAHLTRSVQSRMISDVPLGIFLSGGIDSSTIAYYAQKASAAKIRTFSIGFSEASFDESSYAREVAQFLGTEHHEEILRPQEALDLIPRIADLLDEPMADPSIIPTYLLSRFTRKSVTVALGGDGSDELFAGYDTFRALRASRLYEKLPLSLRKKMIEPLVKLLPETEKNMNPGFIARRFLRHLSVPEQNRISSWMAAFDTPQLQNLLLDTSAIPSEHRLPLDDDAVRIADPNQRQIYHYLRTYLIDDILVKVDRASMYQALEVRAPFLDYELVDFVNDLPYHYKLRGMTTKYLLKKLMRDKLPHTIVYRGKKGFGIPLTRWLRHELKPLAEELLAESRIRQQGIFNPLMVSALLKEHLSAGKDHRKELWTLMVFQMWYDRWYN